MVAVRHFLGFAEDSDARVRGRVRWRRLFCRQGAAKKRMAAGNAVAAQGYWAARGGGGVSARAMSQGPQPLRLHGSAWSNAVWGVCNADGYDDALVVRE